MSAVYLFQYTEHEAEQENPETPDYSMHCQSHQSSVQSFFRLPHRDHSTVQTALLRKNTYLYNPYYAKYFLSHLPVLVKEYFFLTTAKMN